MFEIDNISSKEIDTTKLKEFINFVVTKENLEEAIFNIIFVDNEEIKKINKEYRNIDAYTDVISFALEDNEDNYECAYRVLGDIYISIDKAIEQANLYNHSLEREISFLAIHGLLHLLGYDHMEKIEEEIMFKKQEDYLNLFGLKR